MFKVSFKDKPNDPSKIVVRIGNKTGVMLKGTVILPKFFRYIPDEIVELIKKNNLVSGKIDFDALVFNLKSNGKAVCHEEDKFDYVFGERLAEARAKLKIYRFFYGLCDKLEEYYSNILYGPCGVVDSGSGSCIARDLLKYEGLCIKEARHIGQLLKDKEENG